MGFMNFWKKENHLEISDDQIIAPADGKMIDITTISDPMFAQQLMGKTVAFQYTGSKLTLCAPANGELSVLFPTGHAFGIRMNNGVEILIHCGINTVDAKGVGFQKLKKKQGDKVRAGDPIVEVDLETLSKQYDMSTMLIITNNNGNDIQFIDNESVTLGQIITK